MGQDADLRAELPGKEADDATRVVQKAVFLRHRDGQNMVQRKTSVKAVVRLKPMSMTLTMPTALKASHNVPAPMIRMIRRLALT